MSNNNLPLLSIITPCYNHGIYLDEMLDSVHNYNWQVTFEHIIVNDGSTDAFTIQKLNEVEKQGKSIVIHQHNKGLGATRNAAIAVSAGKYILPLDSDNKIIPEVFVKAINILEDQPEIDVVHTYAILFGQQQGLWPEMQAFNLDNIINKNFIDACALIRASTIKSLGGYDSNMPAMGNEDWDLWVNIGLHGGKFFQLKEPGFFYRVSSNSMIHTMTDDNADNNKAYIFRKYAPQIAALYQELFAELEKNKEIKYKMLEYISNNRFKASLNIIRKKYPLKSYWKD